MSDKNPLPPHSGSHKTFSGNPLEQVLLREKEAENILRKAEEEGKNIENSARDAAKKKIQSRKKKLEEDLLEEVQKEKQSARDYFSEAWKKTENLVADLLRISKEKKQKAVLFVLEEIKNSFSA